MFSSDSPLGTRPIGSCESDVNFSVVSVLLHAGSTHGRHFSVAYSDQKRKKQTTKVCIVYAIYTLITIGAYSLQTNAADKYQRTRDLAFPFSSDAIVK